MSKGLVDFMAVRVVLNCHGLSVDKLEESRQLLEEKGFGWEKTKNKVVTLNHGEMRLVVESGRLSVIGPYEPEETCEAVSLFLDGMGLRRSGLVGLGFAVREPIGNAHKFKGLVPFMFPEHVHMKIPVIEGERTMVIKTDFGHRKVVFTSEWSDSDAKGYFWIVGDTWFNRPDGASNVRNVLNVEHKEYSQVIKKILAIYEAEDFVPWI